MTKKDYELIASRVNKLPMLQEDKAFIARSFGSELLNTNPRFNLKRFIDACLMVPVNAQRKT